MALFIVSCKPPPQNDQTALEEPPAVPAKEPVVEAGKSPPVPATHAKEAEATNPVASATPLRPASAAPASRVYGRWESASFGGGGYIQNVVWCPSSPGRLYAYVDIGGLYRSDDGGASWRMMHGGMPAGDGFYSVRGLWVDPGDANRVIIAVGNQWTANRGIFLSRQSG